MRDVVGKVLHFDPVSCERFYKATRVFIIACIYIYVGGSVGVWCAAVLHLPMALISHRPVSQAIVFVLKKCFVLLSVLGRCSAEWAVLSITNNR